jgi:hypothetical protein
MDRLHQNLAPREQQALDELRALRAELAEFRRMFNDFAGAYLNARFPYGKPADRWPRR